jgi:hypothetical protein
LGSTQRYMHLGPAALDAAIRLLEGAAENRGGIVEAPGTRSRGQHRAAFRRLHDWRREGLPRPFGDGILSRRLQLSGAAPILRTTMPLS